MKEVWDIVEQLTKRKFDKPKDPPWIQHTDRYIETVQSTSLVGFAVLLLIAGAASFFPSDALGKTGLVISALIYLLYCAMFVLVIIRCVPAVSTSLKRPTEAILILTDQSNLADIDNVNRLARCRREAIEYVLAHYRHQRSAFEARGSLLAGQLEKLGLFPALAAFAVGAITLFGSPYQWLRVFAFIVPAMYVIKLVGYGVTQEMDRTIALLEYSLAARDRCKAEEHEQRISA